MAVVFWRWPVANTNANGERHHRLVSFYYLFGGGEQRGRHGNA
jgi:hypothetical protein